MADPKFPRRLVRRLDDPNFPMITLQAVREARAYLDDLERQALVRARELGASMQDIAECLGMTRQGVDYKLKALKHRDGPEEGTEEAP